jgi:hypothetical protein
MTEEIYDISIDDGHFNNKGEMLGKNGEIISFIQPSFVMAGSNTTFSTMDSTGGKSEFITLDGDKEVHFTTLERLRYGEIEHIVDTQNHAYQLSAANRIMVHSMLHRMGLAGKKVNLVTTSPIQRYFKKSGQPDQDYIEARNKNLMVPVTNALGESVEIMKVTQLPESFAAYLSLLFKYHVVKGKGRLEASSDYVGKDILLFDFGGQTLDVAVISNGQLITRKSFTEEGVGMLAVNDLIYDELKSYRRNIDRCEIDRIIQTGRFYTDKSHSNEIDAQGIVNSAIKIVYANGLDKVVKRLPVAEFDLVLGAGGPVNNIRSILSSIIPEMQFVENPLMANANGGLKYLLSQAQKRNVE